MEEILHQLIWKLSHYLHGFIHPGGAGFLPSTVAPGNGWVGYDPFPFWDLAYFQGAKM